MNINDLKKLEMKDQYFLLYMERIAKALEKLVELDEK
jgi:hypothetical protein